ncbi:sigma-70 family RNA polymerase sigma factor [Paraflavitalea sp. CAU 1676]|uniref:sigma-70 family RNA polymerase sigma factor n=1 Tax=Paraflavitalea sp. CAU 1676 TaxID=3032598 RepID=UPI0023DAB00E|nr:sigma-70 family RNA polymerase sigma factor [Paraflavitalea sp. CAU 1676]MDF2188500.1 sigma-70 family RNA polymerase sigma factor [Paraflavitalea sp. CAU 1676]
MSNYNDDKLLLDDLREGEEQAVRHLFHLYYPSLRYFAIDIVKDTQEAEDIAIRAFHKYLESRSQFESLPAIRSFFYTTVKNAGIDYLRKQHTHQRYLQDVKEQAYETADEQAEQSMLEAKVLQLIYEEVERLPIQCSTVFKAYFFEGKDTASIAAALNLSSQTVLNHKARAVQHLRAFVKKNGIFPVALFAFPGLFK